jgi:RNA polymerase sigma factor (sigma-70 family)
VDRVHAYAVRHVGVNGAQDVVSETFLHAWRRWSQVPDPALPWLLGTARKVIGNGRRTERRRDALVRRIAFLDEAATSAEAAELVATRRHAAIQALAALNSNDREALLLVVWDGLTLEQSAKVLGVGLGTLRVRLHRARTRLAAALEEHSDSETEEVPCLTD